MAITKYAIIDHVGSLTGAENKRIYQRVYAQVKQDDLQAYTLKKVCMADSPYAREVTSKMKYRARYQKNPQKVYLICDTLDSTAESVMQIWESRNIPVEVFEVNGFIETHELDLDGKFSKRRRIAAMTAPAFGYTFSAPPIRFQNEIVADNFCKRPDHDRMVASNDNHYTKPYTSAEVFLEMNRCIAPKKEIDKYIDEYLLPYLEFTGCEIETKLGANFGAISGDIDKLQEYLDIDYTVCKCCGHFRNIHNHKDKFQRFSKFAICPNCNTEYEEDSIECSPYYEDSSDVDE